MHQSRHNNPRRHNSVDQVYRSIAATAAAVALAVTTIAVYDSQHNYNKTPAAHSQKPNVRIPTSIPKDRFVAPTSESQTTPQNAPGEGERFPVITSPNQFVNVDFDFIVGDMEAQYKLNGDKPDTKISNLGVPVYMDDKKAGGPVQISLSYIPGTREFTGSVDLDMPADVDAQNTTYYAFFDGQRHALAATFSSPDPIGEPNYRNVISLAIPEGVDTPPPIVP